MKKEKSKDKKKIPIKKIVIIFVFLLIVAGGVLYYVKNKKAKEVSVYSVRELGMDNYWDNQLVSDGMIKEDKMQSVYLSSTQKVEKIAVKEGQNVKVGDVLLKYNTTLSNLELEKKMLEIKKMELDLEKANKELEKIRTYKPNERVEETPVEEDKKNSHTTLPTLSKPLPEVTESQEISPAPLTGEGTNEKPYLFIWNQNKEFEKTFIESLITRAGTGKTEVYAVFMIRENDSITGNLINASKIKFTNNSGSYNFTIIEMIDSQGKDPLYPEEVKEEKPEEPINNVQESYTAAELQKMIYEKEKLISETALNIKIAKNEYNKKKNELKDTVVYSKINGVVKTVLSIDDNIGNKPIIVVSSGGGYLVQGKINELDLDKIKIGQKVNIQSYESGTMTEGTVKELSNVPISGSYWNGMGNSNSSYYPYTVTIPEDANLKADEYASLTLVSEEQKVNSFYLSSAFIITENGKSHVYIANEDNKLIKKDVTIGRNLQGYLEIRDGVTRDDRIAFPYGKNIKEGVSVVDGSIEELYSGM